MKFTSNNKALLNACTLVQVKTFSIANPCTAAFLFSIEGDILHITSTDMSTTINTSLEVVASGSGKVCIPESILIDTLKLQADEPINISVSDDVVTLKTSIGTYKIPTVDYDDNSYYQYTEDITSLNVEGFRLKEALIATLFACSNDDLRAAMTGLYFNGSEGDLVFAATDSHKLSAYTLNKGLCSGHQLSEGIINSSGLKMLQSILPDTLVHIITTDRHLYVRCDKFIFTTLLIDATFPDYKSILPNSTPSSITLNRLNFMKLIQVCQIYANVNTFSININIDNGIVMISSQFDEYGQSATNTMECDYTGDPISIHFNAKIIISCLKHILSDEVVLDIFGPNRAAIIRPLDIDGGHFTLAMPILA